MLSYMVTSSTVEHVGAGGFDQGWECRGAEPAGRSTVRAAALREPVDEVGPPGARPGRRAVEPLLGVGGVVGVEPVARLGVSWRVHQRGDVAAGGQHEAGVAAEQAGAAVAALPWRDVV